MLGHGLRVGLGHDTHRLGPGQALLIGGVEIPHDRRALGHSDADARRLIDGVISGKKKFNDVNDLLQAIYEKSHKASG